VSCLWERTPSANLGILFILPATETTLLKLRVHLNSRASSWLNPFLGENSLK
jgi:hypothetical protein